MLRTDREAENGRGRIVEAGGVLACGVRNFSLRKTHLPCPSTLPPIGRGAIQTLVLCTSAPPLTAGLLAATHSMSRLACDAIIKPVPLRSMIAKNARRSIFNARQGGAASGPAWAASRVPRCSHTGPHAEHASAYGAPHADTAAQPGGMEETGRMDPEPRRGAAQGSFFRRGKEMAALSVGSGVRRGTTTGRPHSTATHGQD